MRARPGQRVCSWAGLSWEGMEGIPNCFALHAVQGAKDAPDPDPGIFCASPQFSFHSSALLRFLTARRRCYQYLSFEEKPRKIPGPGHNIFPQDFISFIRLDDKFVILNLSISALLILYEYEYEDEAEAEAEASPGWPRPFRLRWGIFTYRDLMNPQRTSTC